MKEDKKPKEGSEFWTPIIAGSALVGIYEPRMMLSIGCVAGLGYCTVKAFDIIQEGSLKFRWKKFFEATGIRTSSDEKPTFTKAIETQKGHKYLFKIPIGFSTHQLEQKKTSILEFLNAKNIECEIVGDCLTINATENILPKDAPFEFVKSSQSCLEVAIGKTLDGYAKLNFSKMPHTLIAGVTGSGKSCVTHSIMTQLVCNYKPSKLHIYLADLKRVELVKYKDLPHTKAYVKTVEQTEELIDNLLKICDERYDKFEEMKVNKIEIYNKRTTEGKMPYIVLCIEECVRLVSNKNLQSKLSELLYISRACGVYVILTIQRPTRANISPEIKASLGNIIGLQTVNRRNSEVICEDDRLKKLRGHGHGWIFKDNGEEEFQGFYLNDETDEIDKILEKYCTKKNPYLM